MNYTSSFAEIQLCFSRSRDPIYVTPGRGTCGTSRGISGTTRCIYRDGPRSFWRATRCKNERDIADQAARDRRNGFSSLERPQRRQGQTPSLNKTKRKACVPPRWRWSRCAAPPGAPIPPSPAGPDKSLSSPTGFYLRPVKIARTRNRQIERDCCSREDQRRKYGFRGMRWGGWGPRVYSDEAYVMLETRHMFRSRYKSGAIRADIWSLCWYLDRSEKIVYGWFLLA